MKKALLLTSLLTALTPLTSFAEDSSTPSIYLDGSQLKFELDPVIEKGSTLVPFRAIFEKLGYSITWEESTKGITATKGSFTLKMNLNSTNAQANKKNVYVEVPPHLIGDSTYVPLRFLSEISGKEVTWNGEKRQININSGYDSKDPYVLGEDSFIKKEETDAYLQTKTMFLDGYTYVYWTKDTSLNNVQTKQFFVSIHDGKEWIKRSEVFYTKPTAGTVVDYVDGWYYIRDGSKFSKVRATKDASMKEVLIMLDPLYANTTYQLKTFIGPDGQSPLFNASISQSVYGLPMPITTKFNGGLMTDGSDLYNYRNFVDTHKVLDSVGNGTIAVYDKESMTMFIISNGKYLRLNVTSGEIAFKDGKDDIKPLIPDARENSIKPFIYNGTLYVLYQKGDKDLRYYFSKLNNKLEIVSTEFTNILQEDLNNAEISYESGTIRLHTPTQYNRRVGLQVKEFKK